MAAAFEQIPPFPPFPKGGEGDSVRLLRWGSQAGQQGLPPSKGDVIRACRAQGPCVSEGGRR